MSAQKAKEPSIDVIGCFCRRSNEEAEGWPGRLDDPITLLGQGV